MSDPYSILGVSIGASEEEVTQAYRKLAKRYHPDLNPNNKVAEQKMREINAAYDQIKAQLHGGASYERTDGTYGPQPQYDRDPFHGQGSPFGNGDPFHGQGSQFGNEDPFSSFGGFEHIFGDFFGGGREQRQDTDSARILEARQYIAMRQYQQAIYILAQINNKNRNAEWYYYSAIANAGAGNKVTALAHAKEAARMAPDNTEYRSLLEQFQQGSFIYRQSGQSYGYNMQAMGRTVLQILAAQLFCTFCCRPC